MILNGGKKCKQCHNILSWQKGFYMHAVNIYYKKLKGIYES